MHPEGGGDLRDRSHPHINHAVFDVADKTLGLPGIDGKGACRVSQTER
jgi:hypothetical protein